MLTNKIKSMWKGIRDYKPLCGSFVVDALRGAAKEIDMRNVGKFMAGKFIAYDVLKAWFEGGENDEVIAGVAPFFFVISASDARLLISFASERWNEILTAVGNGEKVSQRMISVATAGRNPIRMAVELDGSGDEVPDLEEPEHTFAGKGAVVKKEGQ
jgi:hypothetical protein